MATGKLPIGDNDTAKAAPKTIVKEVHEVVETLVVTLSRQELYDMIWEISVAGVAKEYDIPYPQLMKQVKAANIPIPPSGYLTKLSFGKPVEKIPLDNPKDSVVSLVKAVKTIITLAQAIPIRYLFSLSVQHHCNTYSIALTLNRSFIDRGIRGR